MEPHFYSTTDKDKKARYEEFLTQYAGLIENERDETSVMANTAAALREAFGFFWVGFYRVTSAEELALGPFQAMWPATASGKGGAYAARRGRKGARWW